MGLVLRYILLLALGVGSFIVLINVTTATSVLVLSGGGAPADSANDATIWAMASLATISLISLLRFAFQGVPLMISDWFDAYKDRLGTLALVFLVGLIFLLI